MADSQVKLSPVLLQQLGGQVWQSRTGFFDLCQADRPAEDLGAEVRQDTATAAVRQESDSDLRLNPSSNQSLSLSPDLESNSAPQTSAKVEATVEMDSETLSSTGSGREPEMDCEAMIVPEGSVSKVFIASGIDSLLDDETSLQAVLWQNIQKAFGWYEIELQLVDVAFIASESAMMNAVDEIIGLNVDQVFVMLDEHPIIEILQEGVELIPLPSLDEMLDDPYAKQQFYQTIMTLPVLQ